MNTLRTSLTILVVNTLFGSTVRADYPFEWITQYGSSGTDVPGAVVVDSVGRAFIAGLTSGNLSGEGLNGYIDVFLSRISSTGNIDFTHQQGTNGATTYGRSIALLNSSTVVVGGSVEQSIPSPGLTQLALFNSTTDGVWQNTTLFGGGVGTDRGVTGLATNAQSIYATGTIYGSFGGPGFITKHEANGNLIWARSLAAGVIDVAADSVGNAYMAGYFGHPVSAGGNDCLLAKYDANGNQTLLRQFGTSGNDAATALALDSSGNIYVTGITGGNLAGQINAGESDAFLMKLDALGNVLWTRLLGGSNEDDSTALAIDSTGNIWIGGNTASSFAGHTNLDYNDVFIAAYDPAGNALTTQFLSTPGIDQLTGLAAGLNGSIFLCGNTSGTFGSNATRMDDDIFVAKIVPEPASTGLLLVGLLGLAASRRRSISSVLTIQIP